MSEPHDRPAWRINGLHSAELPGDVSIAREGVSLGRDPKCSVVIPSAHFPGVSAQHARLTPQDDGGLLLEDLHSRNGTYVNGVKVDRRLLKSGDVVELGNGGPRFAVKSPAALDQTLELPRGATGPRRSIGTETMQMVRAKLGLPQDSGIDELIEKRGRKTGIRLLVLSAALAAVGIWGFFSLVHRGEESRRDLEAKTEELERTIAGIDERTRQALAAVESTWNERERRFEAAIGQWDEGRAALEQERTSLLQRLEELKTDEAETAGVVEALESQLAETTHRLEMYDPVNLEQAKLNEVSRVETAVVFVEVQMVYRDEVSGKTMYYDRRTDGSIYLNDDEEGVPLTRESSGSGFCISPEGHILTNAHVVNKKETDVAPIRGEDYTLVPHLELTVLFSRDPRRHPAELLSWAADGDDDLAILKIEPFDGMQHLRDFALDTPAPPLGSEVFILGFPLGRKAIQQGDTVSASTFRGILSRNLGDILQVDAAVHPGNSGGPLIDGRGRVLGVVTAMQALNETQGTTAIGYIIPISLAGKLWPPPPHGKGANAPKPAEPAAPDETKVTTGDG